MAASRPRRLGPRSLRGRATLAAGLMVGLFVVVFAAAFLSLLRQTLIEEVDEAATQLVRDITLEAGQGLLPDLSAAPEEGNSFIQVIDGSGRVIEGSFNVVGLEPVAGFARPELTIHTAASPIPGAGGQFRIAGQSGTTPDGPVTVYVGRSLDNVDHDIFVAGSILAVGLPLLVTLVGSTTWVLVGRALRPVEAIRSEVADISGSDLHRRVPEPDTRDEIARLAATMNAMLDRLAVATARQRRFVDDASHELRSPLAVLRAEIEVALSRPESPDWPAVATRLLGDVARQERLVQDLLYLARAEAQTNRRPDALVDLDGVVLDEVERVRTRSSISVDLGGVSAAPVRGRAEDLSRVVANLLDNAVRHASHRVRVALGVKEHSVELVVQDDGPGIPPEMRTQIFERFARLDEGRSRDRGGTGLGLAIAREVVEAHGGTIAAEEAPVGARMVVRLPADL